MVLAAGVGAVGCCPVRSGKMSSEWVLAGSDVVAGPSAPPTLGAPLQLGADPDVAQGCVAMSALRRHFGDTCTEHEAESHASPAMNDDVPMGNNPTSQEVMWFCDQRTVVRLSLARCGTAESFKVLQLAVSIH